MNLSYIKNLLWIYFECLYLSHININNYFLFLKLFKSPINYFPECQGNTLNVEKIEKRYSWFSYPKITILYLAYFSFLLRIFILYVTRFLHTVIIHTTLYPVIFLFFILYLSHLSLSEHTFLNGESIFKSQLDLRILLKY